MNDFLDRVNEEINTTIAIDFDGVIHKSSKGVYDGSIYDGVVEDTKDALEYLSRKYKLVIFSCRSRPDRPIVNGKNGTESIWEWLKENNLDEYISDVTSIKPRAKYYIDDKGIRFENWVDILEFIWEDEDR